MDSHSSSLLTNLQLSLNKQNIHVPEDWLTACLEWLQHENQVNQNLLFLQKQIYEQWLLADLRDLAKATLPNQVIGNKYTLNGTYCLQINSIVDISQPFYGQLLHVQKKDDTNSTVSAETQATQKPWETKSSRMLMLKMTDGVTDVSGLEYRTIECLNNEIPPGSKVCIKGPILCRNGVLMLTSSKLQLLGGEVEELFQSHRHEAILCERLGRVPPVPTSNSIQASAVQENDSAVDLPEDLISQLTDDDFVPEPESGYFTGSRPSLRDNTNSSLTNEQFEHLAFDDISDMNMIEEVERVEASQSISNTSSIGAGVEGEVDDKPFLRHWKSSNEVIGKRGIVSDVVDLREETKPNLTRSCPSSKVSKQLSIVDAFKQNPKASSSTVQRHCIGPHLSCKPESPDTDTPSAKQRRISDTFESHKDMTPSPGFPTQPKLATNFKDDGDQFVPSKTSASQCHALPSVERHLVAGQLDAATSRSKPDFVKREAATYLTTDAPMADNSNNSLVPFKYLCDVRNSSDDATSFKVKACVITLLSKLQSTSDHGWCLKARICDGTGVLDVAFSNAVLTDLIGFSSIQAEDVKRSADRAKLSELRSGTARCRDAIIEMCKMMTIDRSSTALPIVRSLSEVDQAHWDRLD